MKHDTFDKYPADSLELPTKALLTIWDCLPDFHADLVLVGGLAVRFLTKPPGAGEPGAVTLDVDFGVSLAADGSAYPGIRENLYGHGFNWVGGRFTRKFPAFDLHVDLLTDDDKSVQGSVPMDDNLHVSVFPGINRALAHYRPVDVTGQTLLGGEVQTQTIKVAEVGPLLVLKLNAFGGPSGRKAPKDAHDILYLVENYLGGTAAAVSDFHQERRVGNRGINSALKCLADFFSSPDAKGSAGCAAFRLNNQHEEPQNTDVSLQIRQRCVTLAQQLLS